MSASTPYLPTAAGVPLTMSDTAQLSARQLRNRYIVAVGLISLLAVASQLFIQFMVSDQSYDSHVLNVAGRQRMLSQRLVKTGMYLVSAESAEAMQGYRQQLGETLELWQEAHAALRQRDGRSALPGSNSATLAAMLRDIDPLERAMGGAAQRLLAAVDGEAVAAAVAAIRRHEPEYLARMEAIASQYEREATAKVETARWLSLGLAAVLLLVLGLQAVLVFVPANRRMREDLERIVERERELERHGQKLEALVEQRTRQLEERALAAEQATVKIGELQQQLTDVFVSTSHGLVLADAEGRILMANPALEALFGYGRGELDGLAVEVLLPEPMRERHVGIRQDFVGSDSSAAHPPRVLQARHRSGGTVPIDLTQRRWQSPTGTRVLATVIDLTERLRYEAELRQASALAEAANMAKSQFLANMSHEIRTPMNAILGFAGLMRRDGVTPRQAERLDRIDIATQHLLGIINDILDLSKIEAGKLALEQTDVAIDAIVANVMSMLFERAQAKGIRLVADAEPIGHRLLGDPTRLQQALLNYASNAVKFTEQGSVILRLRLEAEDAGHVLLRFEVEDSGIGIEADALERLFNMFEQADNSTTRKYGGTGLGLAITRRLAQMMDGETGVDSTPGVGSRFWFTARLAKAGSSFAVAADGGEAESACQPTQASPAGRELAAVDAGGKDSRPTLLIVDDVADNLAILAGILEPEYRILTANSGRRALELAGSERRPDLILLDVTMPGMDGYKVITQLKSAALTRDIPVIFVTAMDAAENEEHGLQLGAVDYITKPIKPSLVVARVRAQLEVKRAHDWLSNQNSTLEIEIARRMKENLLVQDLSIHALAHLAEKRDPETGNHLRRTRAYVHALATRLRADARYAPALGESVDLLAKSAVLHDIGKVGVPDHILLKAGKLAPPEWEIMKTHAAIGAAAIESAERDVGRQVKFLSTARDIARWHHEKWDGSGYPDGLAGADIPLPARIMAIADVFDALISKRVYKPALRFEAARDIIVAERGGHFDPHAVDAFVEVFPEFVRIARRHADGES